MRTGSLLISAILFLFVLSVFEISSVNSEVSKTAILKKKAKKYYWGRGVRQDYTRALQLYEIAAVLGDPQASTIAGGMYYTGKGTLSDPLKAFRYLDFAAEQGQITPDASIALAGFYLQGLIIPQNYTRAIELYSMAADTGNPRAQLELGFLYYTGQGVEQDFSKAYEWFQEAALNNYNMAQYNLGIMWYTGNNSFNRSSLTEAYAWINIAATNRYQDAYGLREYLQLELTEDELLLAQQKSERIYEQIRQRLLATPDNP